jgi:hypothetical protein
MSLQLISKASRTVPLPLSMGLSSVLPQLIPWLIQLVLAAQPITGKRWVLWRLRCPCGLSHIMADSRQIIWRESRRSLCKHSTMTQKVLPHNVAWPFLPFLPSWCCPLSAATLCGRKRPMAPKVALMPKKRVLPDNAAPPIFLADFSWGGHENLWPTCFWEVAPYYASEIVCAGGENPDICARICLLTFPSFMP